MTDLTYISKGNEKTGNCFSFDLPAKITCPGMTDTCGNKCYAAMLMRVYPAVDQKYSRNLKFANSEGFVKYMIRNVPRRCEFRIHVSGDFKDAAYILDWISIASSRKDVEFYCYTRSWSETEMLAPIKALGALPNVTVNLSCDKDTGKPEFPGAESFRWAYLTHEKNHEDAPEWLRKQDIGFRSASSGHKIRRKNAIKRGKNPNEVAPLVSRLGAAPVCPFERGKELKSFSCSQCRICIDKPKVAAIV